MKIILQTSYNPYTYNMYYMYIHVYVYINIYKRPHAYIKVLTECANQPKVKCQNYHISYFQCNFEKKYYKHKVRMNLNVIQNT